MKYRIITNPEYTDVCKVGIETSPKSDPISFFLSAVKLENIPTLIESSMKSVMYGEGLASIRFFSELDWEDKENIGDIVEGEVVINHRVYGCTILSEKIFYKMLHDYAFKVLEVYRGKVSLEWEGKMKEGIEKLRMKTA